MQHSQRVIALLAALSLGAALPVAAAESHDHQHEAT